jgi:rhodanese-related sulfurtransferase
MTLMDAIRDHRENVIDIRETDEFAMKSISGVRNVPMMGLMMNPDQFMNKEETYYLMCASGGRVSAAIAELEPQGYKLENIGGIMHYEGE